MERLTGQKDEYEIVSHLREGGICRIDLARRVSDGQFCVRRKVRDAYDNEPRFEKFFMKGLEFQEKLRVEGHNFAPQIFEIVHDVQSHAMMEFLLGENLQEMLKVLRVLPVATVKRIAIQLLKALTAVHNTGMVHRDICLSNVVDSLGSQAHLIDFDTVYPPGDSMEQLVGKVAYLAPEVWNGSTFDHRIDLYALGVLLYKACCGEDSIFSLRVTLAQLREQHLHASPPELPDSVPDDLRTVIMKLLEKDRKNRFESAQEALKCLESPAA